MEDFECFKKYLSVELNYISLKNGDFLIKSTYLFLFAGG